MNLLADQDVYAATVQFLRGLGHDMATAAERGMSQSAAPMAAPQAKPLPRGKHA